MALFGKERFPKEYQKKVGFSARDLLHKNSQELVKILNNHLLLSDNLKVFELGAGPARNLFYIWKENNTISINCNDLSRNASFENMNDEIKMVLNFIEGDSEVVIRDHIINDIDIFLVSDHFMHLQREKASFIINHIMNEWKPKYILLREVKKDFEAVNHPKLYHNYDSFFESYNMIHEQSSINDETYFILLLKRK